MINKSLNAQTIYNEKIQCSIQLRRISDLRNVTKNIRKFCYAYGLQRNSICNNNLSRFEHQLSVASQMVYPKNEPDQNRNRNKLAYLI